MAEERLEEALQEMRHESVDDKTLDTVRARVWGNVTGVAGGSHAEAGPGYGRSSQRGLR